MIKIDNQMGKQKPKKNTNQNFTPKPPAPPIGVNDGVPNESDGGGSNRRENKEENKWEKRAAKYTVIGSIFAIIYSSASFYWSNKTFEENLSLTKEQFKIENTPYLTISKVHVYPIEEGIGHQIYYEISNVTENPVQVVRGRSIIQTDFIYDEQKMLNSITDATMDSMCTYVAGTFTYKTITFTQKPIDKVSLKGIKGGFLKRFWSGEVFYENPVNKNVPRKYVFVVEILPNDTTIIMRYQKNFDIK